MVLERLQTAQQKIILGAYELGLRLLPFLERRSLAFVEIFEPLLDDLREIELGAYLVHD